MLTDFRSVYLGSMAMGKSILVRLARMYRLAPSDTIICIMREVAGRMRAARDIYGPPGSY